MSFSYGVRRRLFASRALRSNVGVPSLTLSLVTVKDRVSEAVHIVFCWKRIQSRLEGK